MKLKSSRKKWVIIILCIALVGGGIAYARWGRSPKSSIKSTAVTHGTITQEVIVTGNVTPVVSINLAFEQGGRIQTVTADVGNRVGKGDILVKLDSSELEAQLAQANASGNAEKAKLADLEAGAQPEDIQVARTALLQAQQTLTNDYNSVTNILHDAYTNANDAVENQLNAIYTNANSGNPTLSFTISDSQIQVNASTLRAQVEGELTAWKKELDALGNGTPTNDALDQILINGEKRLGLIRTLLTTTLDALSSTPSLSQSTINSYRTSANTGLTNVNTSFVNVTSQEQTISSQKITVQQKRDELALKLAGATPEAIKQQEAKVEQAQANTQNIEVRISKMTLRAPISGIITKQNAKVGQIAAANAILTSIISNDALEINANIPEADIAKMKVGDNATLTLDALGNGASFNASVISIDPAETMIEGVATYLTKLRFSQNDPRVKSGMTANLTIQTNRRENVLTIPQRAVRITGTTSTVEVILPNGKTEPRDVRIGLRGSDGMVEVLSGLTEGDRVAARASSQ